MKHDSAFYVLDSCRGYKYSSEDCPDGQICLPHYEDNRGYCSMYFLPHLIEFWAVIDYLCFVENNSGTNIY